MLMNLGRVITDLPLYDQEGNLVSGSEIDFTPNFSMFDPDVEKVQKLLAYCTAELNSIEDLKANLEFDEDVNIYEDVDPSGISSDYYSVKVRGGENGLGHWSNYLLALYQLLERLEATFQDAWIIAVDVDVPDDIFDVEIGIRIEDGQLD